jgi:hypothetical protein
MDMLLDGLAFGLGGHLGGVGLVDVEEFIARKQRLSIPLPSIELIEIFLLRGVGGLKVFQSDLELARAGLASKG